MAAAFALLSFFLIAPFATAADTTGPDIALNEPTNFSTNPYNRTNFTYTPLDDGKITNCGLYVNGSVYGFATAITNNTKNNFSDVEVVANGTYFWYVQCTDNSTNTRASGQNSYVVSVDKTPPRILLSTGNSSLNSSSGAATFTYNAMDRESGLNSCELIVDSKVESTTNTPANGTDSVFSVTVTSTGHTWSVNCTDRNGNEGASSAALLLPGEIAYPGISAISPANNTIDGDGVVSFNFTPSTSENLSLCVLFLNQSVNRTLYNPKKGEANSFANVELYEGFWRWSINCSSTTGKNSGTETYFLNVSVFELLTNYLFVKANSPDDKYFDKTGSPTFTYTPSSISDIESCALITNNSVRESTRSVKSHTINSFSSIDIGDGAWNWRIECKNSEGLVVSTELRTLSVSKAIAIGGPPVPADVVIPGLGSPIDLGEINVTLEQQKQEIGRLRLLTIITIASAAAAAFVFVITHPKYKKMLLRQIGTGKVMQVENLKFYIDQNLRRGVSEERIRRQLKKYNWDEKDIDDAFQEVYAEMAEELKAKKSREG